MKRHTWITILILSLAAALVLCACGGGGNEEERLREEGYVRVTYDAGEEGRFQQKGRTAYFMTKKGSPTIRPTEKQIGIPVRAEYIFVDWYLSSADGELSAEPYDFSLPVEEDITLVAVWRQGYFFRIVVDGEVIASYTGTPGGTLDLQHIAPPKRAGYTFLGYYCDEACTIPFTEETAHSENFVDLVYTSWMEGEWIFVSDAAELRSALVSPSSPTAGIYLTQDIDCTDMQWPSVTLTRPLSGNGHTISNITYRYEHTSRSSYNFGLFGLLSGGKIENVTFAHCDLAFRLPSGIQMGGATFNVGFLCGTATQSSVISNVTLTDCALTVEDLSYAFSYTFNCGNSASEHPEEGDHYLGSSPAGFEAGVRGEVAFTLAYYENPSDQA